MASGNFVVDNGSADFGPRRTNFALPPIAQRRDAHVQKLGLLAFGAMGATEVVARNEYVRVIGCRLQEKIPSCVTSLTRTWIKRFAAGWLNEPSGWPTID
jgi:hypothetical protein